MSPNDPYMGCTAPLTSKRFILYIYSTNIGTEYFKHALHPPFSFSSICSLFHNANLFGSCIIHILYTGCAKITKNNNSGVKGLIEQHSKFLLHTLQVLYMCTHCCTNQNRHWNHHRWHATNSLERTRLSCWCL